jgi:hypothetical protein
MQYWKHKTSGKVERIEDIVLEKHPEKLIELQKNYEQVNGESDFTPFKKVTKKIFKKKKKK